MFARSFGTVLALICLADGAYGQRNLQVFFDETPPLIDGMIAAGEWNVAAPPQDGWLLVGTDILEPYRNRVTALWDPQGIYLLHQSKYNNWVGLPEDDPPFVRDMDHISLSLDPNTDGEPFARPPEEVDAYDFRWNVPFGFSQKFGDPGAMPERQMGEFIQAHVNGLVGDQGGDWSRFQRATIAQRASDAGNVTELFIPWNEFNAANPTPGGSQPPTKDPGLFHPNAPKEGEQWLFNMGTVLSTGEEPTWNTAAGSESVVAPPAGTMTFANFMPGDCDGDGDVDFDDMRAFCDNDKLGTTSSDNPRADMDGDGFIDSTDHALLVNLLGLTKGDVNGDGNVRASDDGAVLISNLGSSDGCWTSGDFDCDGMVTASKDGADFLSNLSSDTARSGDGSAEGPESHAVPEPSTGGPLALIVTVGVMSWLGRGARGAKQRVSSPRSY